jgi:HlyD family secretion protein
MSVGMDRPVRQKWWRSRRVVLAGGAAAVLCVVAFMALAFAGPARRSVRVDRQTLTIEPVVQGVFHDFTPLQGKIAPKDTLYLDALEGGQVQEVLVLAGDRVTKGQPLVRFHNTQVEREVLQAEAISAQSLTQTQQYETQLEANHASNERVLDQIDYDIIRLRRASERRAAFKGQGVFPQEQLDMYEDELNFDLKQRPVQAATNKTQDELRRQQLPGIRQEISRLEESMVKARERLDDLVEKAPLAGRLTVLDLKIGQNAKQGERLAELVPDTGFKVSADVDEYYLGRVQPGQTGDGVLEGRPVKLKVSRIYPQVKDGVFKADLEFQGDQPTGLTPGEAVQGRLSLGGDQPALVLPAGAFLDRSGGDYAFVVSANGNHADRRRIKIGRRNNEEVEVLSGLKPGERVVTSDYESFEKLDRIDFK